MKVGIKGIGQHRLGKRLVSRKYPKATISISR